MGAVQASWCCDTPERRAAVCVVHACLGLVRRGLPTSGWPTSIWPPELESELSPYDHPPSISRVVPIAWHFQKLAHWSGSPHRASPLLPIQIATLLDTLAGR
jgi:hypothetical protein